MRWMTVALVGLVAAFLIPGHGHAQFSLMPMAGLYTPLSDLLDARDDEGMPILEAGRKSSTLALGLAAELGSPDASLGGRLQLGYATSSDVPVTGVGCEDCELRSTLLTVTAGVILRPLPGLLVLRPHFVVGGGVKRYDFEREDLEREGWEGVLRSQTRPTVHLAAGGTLRMGFVRPRFELGAFLSRIEGVADGESSLTARDNLQTDLFLTVAIPLVGR